MEARAFLGVIVIAASLHSSSSHNHTLPFPTSEAVAACKGKKESDPCKYSASSLESNYLFTYSHDWQLKQDIREYLSKRGLEKQDWFDMIAIKNVKGKLLDLSFLHLPDIFDGSVTPNDFPVKVYLQDTWKGTCFDFAKNRSPGKPESTMRKLGYGLSCAAGRATLVHACVGKGMAAPCTYKSLEREIARINKETTGEMSAVGKCYRLGKPWFADGLNHCWITGNGGKSETSQIEACLGKPAGSTCQVTTRVGHHTIWKGLCLGSPKGNSLSCKAFPAAKVYACDGKMVGDKCQYTNPHSSRIWDKAWCGYEGVGTHLTCHFPPKASRRRRRGKSSPTQQPMPIPSPAPEGELCFSKSEVKAMRGIFRKFLPEKPSPPSRRRR